jgi:hypothetical protein
MVTPAASSVTLTGRNRLWIILPLALAFGFLPGSLFFVSGLIQNTGDVNQVVLLLISLFYMLLFGFLPLWQLPWQDLLILDVANRQIVLSPRYVLGKRERRQSIPLQEVERIKLQPAGWNLIIVIQHANRKQNQFVFSTRQRAQGETWIKTYQLLKKGEEGLEQEVETAVPEYKPIASPEALRKYLKKQASGLFGLALFQSALAGLDLMTGLSLLGMVNMVFGLIYLIAAWGIRREQLWAAWVGLLSVFAERGWNYFYASANGITLSPFSWIVAVLMLFLWLGVIGTIRDLQTQSSMVNVSLQPK